MQYPVMAGNGAEMVLVATLEYSDPPAGFELGEDRTLTWIDLPADVAAAVKPHTRLTRGHESEIGVVRGARFREHVGGKQIVVRVEGRPALAEALDWLHGLGLAAQEARQAFWQRQEEEREARQHARVPPGHVYLRLGAVTHDGWVESWNTPDGRNVVGVELAGGQRAETGMGNWAYATPEAIEAALARQAERDREEAGRTAAARQRAAAEHARLLAMAVPAYAVAAYREHGGSAERAWKREDETAYALVVNWGAAIEAQGLAVPDLAIARPEDPSEMEH